MEDVSAPSSPSRRTPDRRTPDRRTPDRLRAAGDAGPATTVLPLSRLSYVAVLMVVLIAVVCTGITPWLAWTFLIPVLLVLWIRRLRTEISPEAITAVGTFGTTQVAWEDVKGLRFAKFGSARAECVDGSSVRLPAVTFRDLPLIAAASGGRIPDPYAAHRAATELEAKQAAERKAAGAAAATADDEDTGSSSRGPGTKR